MLFAVTVLSGKDNSAIVKEVSHCAEYRLSDSDCRIPLPEPQERASSENSDTITAMQQAHSCDKFSLPGNRILSDKNIGSQQIEKVLHFFRVCPDEALFFQIFREDPVDHPVFADPFSYEL